MQMMQTPVHMPDDNVSESAWEMLIGVTSEPQHDKTNKMTCAPSKDSDKPGHPPRVFTVFNVRMKKPWVLSYPYSDSVDAHRLVWVFAGYTCHFVGFVMLWLSRELFSIGVRPFSGYSAPLWVKLSCVGTIWKYGLNSPSCLAIGIRNEVLKSKFIMSWFHGII